MREITERLKKAILNLENFVYCFEIKLERGKTLYLTSSDKLITAEDKIFEPNSGLTLTEGVFNDSAKDHIILEGIFEQGGIAKEMDLTSAEVIILLYFSGHFYHFVTYNCINYTKYDLTFNLWLEPETLKYEQSLLNVFSKTCRASFGDIKCKMNKGFYSFSYEITEIIGNIIRILNMDKENGYFNDGEAIIGDEVSKIKILNHFTDCIELNQVIPDHLKHSGYVKLISGCDKKFITCCNKFDNAVNFRGEPLIPEYSFLKIS